MCFGQPVNNDVLKLVQEEMATLVISVEENKETWVQDHEGLRKNLQNLTQLFELDIKRLEASHVALESGLSVLKEDQLRIKETLVENEMMTSSNASLIQHVKDSYEEKHKGLQCQQELLEGKVAGLSQGMEKLISEETNWLTSGLCWKIPVTLVLSILMIFIYEHYTPGSKLRYWYSRRGSIQGHTLSFFFKTNDHQRPLVNGIEFSWEALRKKMNLKFRPLDDPGVRYYLNIDRCAYGGIVLVRSLLDNTPQVRGAEVLAVNSDCSQVFYNDVVWRPYQSASSKDIRCVPANG